MAAEGLALTIPPKKISAWVAETHPKETRKWLSTLPMADTQEAARELYQALYTLNRQDLAPTDRFKLMALYDEPVGKVVRALEGHLKSASIPLNPRGLQIVEMCRQLYLEMAYGYKCVLHDLESGTRLLPRTGLKRDSVERALFYHGRVLLLHYQVYMPCPRGLWREIHALYRYSELNQWFGETPYTDHGRGGSSVMARYLQLVLLGICNPYQLPAGDCRRIDGYLEKWAGMARVVTDVEVADTESCFLVDLRSDSPPAPYPKDVSVQRAEQLRLLFTEPLLRITTQFASKLREGESAVRLDLGMECLEQACGLLLERMSRAWRSPGRRQRERTRRDSACLVAVGTSAVHFFLNGQRPFVLPSETDLDLSVPLDFGAAPAINDEDGESVFIDLDETTRQASSDNSQKHKDTQDKARHAGTKPHVYRVEHWQIRDESPHGLQIVSDNTESRRLSVGSLVAVQEIGEPEQWRIGAVRWLKTPKPGRLEAGIELLGSGGLPVTVGYQRAGIREYEPGIWLPPVQALRRPATLIVPSGIYMPQRHLSLLDNEDEAPREVVALNLMERAPHFEHLVYANARTAASG